MPFTLKPTPLAGLVVIQPQVFTDARGYFLESFSERVLEETGINTRFVQDNVSFSQRGTVRGLHFQAPPYAQAKLVYVLQGSVRDVAVDIRRSSHTYGKSFALELSEANHTMLLVPEGFAHGFSVLSETCLFCYKCSNYYDKASEGSLLWSDPSLGIDWQVEEPIVSDKDKVGPVLAELKSPFS